MYNYQTEKPQLATPSGQEMLAKIRRNAKLLLTSKTTTTVSEMMKHVSGDGFVMLACIHYLDECGFISLLPTPAPRTQEQVYIRGIHFNK